MNVLLSGLYPQGVTGLAPFYLKAYHTIKSESGARSLVSVKGYDVASDSQAIVEDICASAPDIVGFSCYIWNINQTLQVCQALRKRLPRTAIILGGPEVSPVALSAMKRYDYIDAIVAGEGEVTCSQLIEHFEIGNRDLDQIDGITYRYAGQIYQTRPRIPIANLDEIPSPFLENIAEFTQFRGYLYGYETFRGCPYRCNYCYWGRMQKIRFFPIERIEKELAIITNSSLKRLWLSDSVANLVPERFKRFLRTLIDNNTKTIFDFEMVCELLDEETIELLGQLRDGYIAFGLQSCNKRALSSINRSWAKSKFEKNIRLLRQRTDKIKIYIDLIFGLPGDNLEGYMNSIDYSMSLLPQKIQPHPLLILPGSPFFAEPEKYGILYDEEAPHQVIQSNTFSRVDIEAAAEWSNKLFFYFNPCVSTTVIMLSQILEDNPFDLFRRLLECIAPKIDFACVSTDIGIAEEHALGLVEALRLFVEQELPHGEYDQFSQPLFEILSFLAYKTMFYIQSPHQTIEHVLPSNALNFNGPGIPATTLKPLLNSDVIIKIFPYRISTLYDRNILKLPDQLLGIEKIPDVIVFKLETHSIYRISLPAKQLLELCDGKRTLTQVFETFITAKNRERTSATYSALNSVIGDLFARKILTI